MAQISARLSYSARRYDSAICCSKMSRDAFLSEARNEGDSAFKVHLKSLLEHCGSARVYRMLHRGDGKLQMYVLFCYFA